jgi:hypothetical protein
MNGGGFLLFDCVVTVLCVAAGLAQAICLQRDFREAHEAGLAGVLRLFGWIALAVRFMFLLAETGDLPIGLPSLVAITCLAMAEVTAAATHKRC